MAYQLLSKCAAADLEMVLADVSQGASQHGGGYAYPLQSRTQMPTSTETTETSEDSTDGHESTLPSPSRGHSKVTPP